MTQATRRNTCGVTPAVTPQVALVTCEEFHELTADDRLLAQAFKNQGAQAEPLVWTEDQFDRKFDFYVLRSPWDYHLRIDDYLQWSRRSKEQGRRFINANGYVEWNFHKKYLVELRALGLPVIETEVLEQVKDDFAPVLEAVQTSLRAHGKIVVKPAISASAFETKVFMNALSREDLQWLRGISRRSDLLLQPFIEEIANLGELSLVWLGDRLSHGYLKTPKPGDFRSQEEYGAQMLKIDLQDAHRILAKRFLDAAQSLSRERAAPHFARVDLLTRNGVDWFLGELELFEPALQFHLEPGSADLLAMRILER